MPDPISLSIALKRLVLVCYMVAFVAFEIGCASHNLSSKGKANYLTGSWICAEEHERQIARVIYVFNDDGTYLSTATAVVDGTEFKTYGRGHYVFEHEKLTLADQHAKIGDSDWIAARMGENETFSVANLREQSFELLSKGTTIHFSRTP